MGGPVSFPSHCLSYYSRLSFYRAQHDRRHTRGVSPVNIVEYFGLLDMLPVVSRDENGACIFRCLTLIHAHSLYCSPGSQNRLRADTWYSLSNSVLEETEPNFTCAPLPLRPFCPRCSSPTALPPSPPELYGIGREQSLLQRHHPSLVRKLRELGVQPLQLAMPWIQFGFVTYLEADQASAPHRVCCCRVACGVP